MGSITQLFFKYDHHDHCHEHEHEKDVIKQEHNEESQISLTSPEHIDQIKTNETNPNLTMNIPVNTNLNIKEVKSIIKNINIPKKNLDDSYNSEQSFNPETDRPKKNIELLDLLFEFLNTDNELNYVLVGYFVNIMNFLFEKNTEKVNIINNYLNFSDFSYKIIYFSLDQMLSICL